jgi:hypothetical protein
MATYGANFLTGGTASASTDRGGTTYAASKAVDANESTRWATNDSAWPGWWKYDLGVGVTKVAQKLGYVLKSSEATRGFQLFGSNDDSTWTTLYQGEGANNQDWQYYTFQNNTAFRYYKFHGARMWAGVVISISEIGLYELTEDTGVTLSDYSLIGQGTITSSADRASYLDDYAADWSDGSRWATPDNVTTGWWKYDLGAGLTGILTSFMFLAVSSERPNAFTVQASNDGTNWDTLYTGNGANVNTWQTFAISNTTAYRYHKMDVTSVYAGIVVSVSEIRFWEAKTYSPPAGGGASFQAVFVI